MSWFEFWDMHSGGGQKLEWSKIYVEAESKGAAVKRFKSELGRNPLKVTCGCCGPDYSVSESQTLEEATGYQRNCRFDATANRYVEEPDMVHKPHVTLENYIANGNGRDGQPKILRSP